MVSVYRPGSLLTGAQEGFSERRKREGDAARRIAEALHQAGDALAEWIAARAMDAQRPSRGLARPDEVARLHLERLARVHLRDCARVADEMQRALSLALGDWVLGDDLAGTGLTSSELAMLRAVAGYAE